LMQRVEDWARRKGCTMMRLRASEDGAALYTTLGFVPGREMEKTLTAERSPHDDDDRRT